jgi:hypothetical protein
MFPVFIDQIADTVTVSDLRKLFSSYGRVLEVTIIR